MARGWLVAAVVVVALAVTADRVAEHVAQDVLASRAAGELGVRPAVEIGGFPFLTQALGGRYRDLRLSAPAVREAGVALADVDVRLTGAHVPLSAVLRGTVGSVPVDGLRVQALLPYDALAARAGGGVRLAADPAGVRVSGTVRVLGQRLPATAVASLAVRDGQLVLTAGQVQAAGVSVPVPGALDVQVPVPELPYGVQLTGATAGPRGVTVTGSATGTVLTP